MAVELARPLGAARQRPRIWAGVLGWTPVLLPVLVALALGFWGIDRDSMYIGEEATYWAAGLPVHDLFRVLAHIDAVHGCYYLLMHAVLSFGGGDAVLRIPSVIAMAAAVGITAAIARRLGASPRVSALAGLLLAVTPTISDYGQSARSYTIDVTAVAATTLVLLWTLEVPARRRWVLYGAMVCVSGYLHEMTTLMILAHGATLCWSGQRSAVLRRWAAACVAALVLLAPLIVVSQAQAGQLAYVRAPTEGSVQLLLVSWFGPSGITVAIMLAAIGLGALGIRRTRGELSLQQLALPLVLVPPAVLLIESTVARPLYAGPRYVLYCLPAAALLAASGIDRLLGLLRSRAAAATGSALVVAAVVFGLNWPAQQLLRTPAGHLDDMAGASTFLGEHAVRGDAVLYIPAGIGLAPLGYPSDFREVTAIARAESPLQAANLYGAPVRPMSRVVAAMRARRRIWVVYGMSLHGPGARGTRELLVLQRHFRLTLQSDYHGVSVRLYLRHSHAHRSSSRRSALCNAADIHQVLRPPGTQRSGHTSWHGRSGRPTVRYGLRCHGRSAGGHADGRRGDDGARRPAPV